jgi:hypothetical protein
MHPLLVIMSYHSLDIYLNNSNEIQSMLTMSSTESSSYSTETAEANHDNILYVVIVGITKQMKSAF